MCDVWLNKVTQLVTKPFAGGGGYFTTVINRPVSYSNGWTGSSMKWRLMLAN